VDHVEDLDVDPVCADREIDRCLHAHGRVLERAHRLVDVQDDALARPRIERERHDSEDAVAAADTRHAAMLRVDARLAEVTAAGACSAAHAVIESSIAAPIEAVAPLTPAHSTAEGIAFAECYHGLLDG
jgi:hypothetical protein